MPIDRCLIRSIGRTTDGEAKVGTGTGTSTAGGPDSEGVAAGGGAIGGGRVVGCGVGVGVDSLVIMGEFPPGGDIEVEPGFRKDHGSRKRLTDLRCWFCGSGSKLTGRSSLERGLGNRWNIFDILVMISDEYLKNK